MNKRQKKKFVKKFGYKTPCFMKLVKEAKKGNNDWQKLDKRINSALKYLDKKQPTRFSDLEEGIRTLPCSDCDWDEIPTVIIKEIKHE